MLIAPPATNFETYLEGTEMIAGITFSRSSHEYWGGQNV